MREKLKDKRFVYPLIGVIALIIVTIVITYAYWLITKTQTNSNVISSGCLDIDITGEANDITLENQFPLSDEAGMELTPYTFTITNNCSTSVDYQIALEVMGEESNAIASSALKVALNGNVTLLSDNTEIDATISGSYEARRLAFSRLSGSSEAGSTDAYELRIWLDADAPISEMNKTFESKISVTVGQGVESSYEEGTLAYSILSNIGGAGLVSEIDVTEIEHRVTATSTSFYIPTSSNYYYGTSYTYDETTGKYTLSGTVTQSTTTSCRSTANSCGVYTLKQTSSSATSATLYEITDFGTSGSYVTANTIKYTTPFAVPTAANDTGIYKTQDDLGDSYYFRGTPTNNYVQFGEYAEETTLRIYDSYEIDYLTIAIPAGTPMYWRIVRVNGDGTVRMIYDGTALVANGTAHVSNIGNTAYNTNYNDAKYVGYTYANGETQTDSTIKTKIDIWYDKHLETNYGSYIADNIFCNDRRIDRYEYLDSNYSQTTQENAAYTNVYYKATVGIEANTPSLKCEDADRYTVNEKVSGKNTNGLLSNPVGLITADEVMFAGIGPNSYLNNGETFWTSTPGGFYGGYADAWFVFSGGTLSRGYYLYNDFVGARPVINLKADTLFEGTGTISDPYKIS